MSMGPGRVHSRLTSRESSGRNSRVWSGPVLWTRSVRFIGSFCQQNHDYVIFKTTLDPHFESVPCSVGLDRLRFVFRLPRLMGHGHYYLWFLLPSEERSIINHWGYRSGVIFVMHLFWITLSSVQASITGTTVTGLKGCKTLNKDPDPKNPLEGVEER